MQKAGSPRIVYVCVPCRFNSKYAGLCPKCSTEMRGLYDYTLPRKRDDDEWLKIQLIFYVHDSGLVMCNCWMCKNPRQPRLADVRLRDYRDQIRRRRTHRQEGVPRYSKATGRYYR